MTNNQSRVRLSGPLKSFGTGFAAVLSRQGYTLSSVSRQMQLMAHMSRWMIGEDLDSHGLSHDVLERFLDARRAAGYADYLTGKALHPLLTYLRRLGEAPPPPAPTSDGPVEEQLARFRLHLTVERGLAPASSQVYVNAVRPFLRHRLSSAGLDLEKLSAGDVTAFVVAHCPQMASSWAKMTVTSLRSFLIFLHFEGVIAQSLAAAVPSVAGWRLAGLPKGLEPIEVRSLFASCDRYTANGRRDFAILTMLARLGLRAGEIAGLGLNDVDWRAGEIVVHGKGSRVDRLPLPVDVGEAVEDYLRLGRPKTAEGRAVFVRVKAPHRALSNCGVNQVVVAAGRRAGLREINSHRLRHTAATEMLRAGASLGEIGQVLRHRRVLTTAIYAKVDREALRTIARPWSGGVA